MAAVTEVSGTTSGIVNSTAFTTVPISLLTKKATLRCPIYDAANVLLLAAGSTVSPSLVDRLKLRGISAVKVHVSELARLGCGVARNSKPATGRGRRGVKPVDNEPSGDRETGEVEWSLERIRYQDPVSSSLVRRAPAGYDQARRQIFAEANQKSLDFLAKMFESLDEVRSAHVATFEDISAESLNRAVEDIDLFVSLGLTPEIDKYPAQHSHQSAMLALALGANLGLDKASLMRLGVGCLAHDTGMLHLDRTLYEAPVVLDRVSFLGITRHPSITFEMMRSVEHLAGTARLVAYQVHERCDGSGYPRGRQDRQIHLLSKIAAVADVFTALVSPRPYRPALMPYYAMEHLLRGARQGLFDPLAVRGLLQTVSLFPIGSSVQLNDDRVARVLRANGTAFTKPVVAAWNRGCLDA